jgi:hypothetical protein
MQDDPTIQQALTHVDQLVDSIPTPGPDQPYHLDRNTLSGLLVAAWMDGNKHGQETH